MADEFKYTGEFKYTDEQYTSAGQLYAFMLAKPTTLSNVSSSPFAPKSVWGDRTYADYDAISAVGLTNWAGGMGQERLTDATMYYDAVNVDTRSGTPVLGPYVTAANAPYQTPDWGQRVAGSHAIGSATCTKYATKITTAADHGKVQRIWVTVSADKGVGTVTLRLMADNAGVPGTEVGHTALALGELFGYGTWVHAVFNPDPMTVTPNTTYWIVVEQTTAIPLYWHYFTDTSTTNTLKWNGSAWVAVPGVSMGVWFDDYLVRPDAAPFFVPGAGGDGIARVYFHAGRTLYYFGQTPTPVPVKATVGGAVKVMDDDIRRGCWFRTPADTHSWLYLPLSEDADIERFNGNIGAEEWQTQTGHRARVLCVHDDLLVYADNRNVVDAYNGTQWGKTSPEPVAVGDKTYGVRNMVSWNGAVWIGKSDGLFKLTIPAGYPVTGSLACQKIIDFSALADDMNFTLMRVHQGDLYFSMNNGLLRFTVGNVLQSIGPDTTLNVAADRRYHYCDAVSVLGTLFVLAEAGLAGTNKLLCYTDGHWHPLLDFSATHQQFMRSCCLDPGWYGNLPRLWFGLGSSPQYVLMPTTTQRRWLWDEATYSETGYILSSWIDGNVRTVEKDWMLVEVDARTVSPTCYLRVWWRPNEDTAFVALGTVTTPNEIAKLPFPAGSHSTKLQLKVEFVRPAAAPTETPRLEALILKYMERPDDIRSHTRAYKLADRLENRNGAPWTRNLAQQLDDLRTLRQAKEPLQWRSWYGVTRSVHVVNYSVTEIPDEQRDTDDKGAMLAVVTLQEVG